MVAPQHGLLPLCRPALAGSCAAGIMHPTRRRRPWAQWHCSACSMPVCWPTGCCPPARPTLHAHRLSLCAVVPRRPLAGTRRRGATPEADEQLEKELLADEKECAEHVMLVDLGRNDVGKVRLGSRARAGLGSGVLLLLLARCRDCVLLYRCGRFCSTAALLPPPTPNRCRKRGLFGLRS